MPRKTTATLIPATAKAAKGKIAQSVTFQSIDSKADEMLDDEEADDPGEDQGMLEMLNMLQEFQKRKASKTSTRSAAFHSKKTVLFANARQKAETIVRDGTAYIDECQAKIAELKAQEMSQDNHIKDLSLLWKNHDECVRSLLGVYPSLIEDISRRRAGQINDASTMLEEHLVERQKSRRRLILNAKMRMDENLEKQKLATDASALIKHYKALLLS